MVHDRLYTEEEFVRCQDDHTVHFYVKKTTVHFYVKKKKSMTLGKMSPDMFPHVSGREEG